MQKSDSKGKGNNKKSSTWTKVLGVLTLGFAALLSFYGHLLDVGAGFSSRSVCSGLWVSGRDLENLQQHELSGVASLFFVYPDLNKMEVHASLLGLSNLGQYLGPLEDSWRKATGEKTSKYISRTLGCRIMDSGDKENAIKIAEQHTDLTKNIHIPKNVAETTTSFDSSSVLRVDSKFKRKPTIGSNPLLDKFLDEQFSTESHATNQSRAVVVVHRGKVVGERYAEEHNGHKVHTRLLGWSMTKSVHALIIGAAAQRGLLGPKGIHTPCKLFSFSHQEREQLRLLKRGQANTNKTNSKSKSKSKSKIAADTEGEGNITFADLINMSDLLGTSENYAIHADVPYMLYAVPDAAKQAIQGDRRMGPSKDVNTAFQRQRSAGSGRGEPNLGYDYPALWEKIRSDSDSDTAEEGQSQSQGQKESETGTNKGNSNSNSNSKSKRKSTHSNLGWYYSSGLSNVLASEFRALFKSDEDYYAFPHEALFHPIGIENFVLETDGAGTYVASSFGFATARDWAKLGQLMLNKGAVTDKNNVKTQVISEDFVEWAVTPHPHSGGLYGGSVWLNPSTVDVKAYNDLTHVNANKVRFRWITHVLPPDAFAFNGYLGQTVTCIPSLDVVVVRIGFTKGDSDERASDLEREGESDFSRTSFFRGILEALAV